MAEGTNQADLIAALGTELEKMNAAASLEVGACLIETIGMAFPVCVQATPEQCAKLGGGFVGGPCVPGEAAG